MASLCLAQSDSSSGEDGGTLARSTRMLAQETHIKATVTSREFNRNSNIMRLPTRRRLPRSSRTHHRRATSTHIKRLCMRCQRTTTTLWRWMPVIINSMAQISKRHYIQSGTCLYACCCVAWRLAEETYLLHKRGVGLYSFIAFGRFFTC